MHLAKLEQDKALLDSTATNTPSALKMSKNKASKESSKLLD
jgi:hypothetical protein